MGSQNKVVEHSGVVEEVLSKIIKVRIVHESACASCHAKGACNASDMQEKIIDVYPLDIKSVKIGSNVIIQGQQSLGLKAAFIAYILPFILVAITLFVSYALTKDEAISGIASLVVLVPYFLLIKYLSPRLQKSFVFTLKQIIE